MFVHLPGHKIAATSPDITYKTRPHPAKVEGLLCFFFEQENLFQKYLRKYSVYFIGRNCSHSCFQTNQPQGKWKVHEWLNFCLCSFVGGWIIPQIEFLLERRKEGNDSFWVNKQKCTLFFSFLFPTPNILFLYQLTFYSPFKNQLKYFCWAVFPDFFPIRLITLFTVLPRSLACATFVVFTTSLWRELRLWSN